MSCIILYQKDALHLVLAHLNLPTSHPQVNLQRKMTNWAELCCLRSARCLKCWWLRRPTPTQAPGLMFSTGCRQRTDALLVWIAPRQLQAVPQRTALIRGGLWPQNIRTNDCNMHPITAEDWSKQRPESEMLGF